MFLILVCTLLLSWYIVFRYRRRRLYELTKDIPSPLAVSKIFGLLLYSFDGVNLSFPMVKDFVEYAYNNGGILKFWVGPLYYIGTISSRDVECILKKFVDKESLETLLRCVLGNAGIFAPADIWTRRRKIIVPAFSPKIVNSFFDIIVDRSESLTEHFRRENRIGTGQFIAWPYVSAYTLSAVAETSLGVKLNVQSSSNTDFLDTVNKTLMLMTRRLLSVWLWPDWMYRLSPSYRETERCKAILHGLTDQIIQERREALKDFDMTSYNNSIFGQGSDNVKSFLDHLILQSGDNRVTDIELREEILVLLLAGTDTSAVAISNTLLLLAKYPSIQEKVYAELTEVFKGSYRRIERDDLHNLPYLQRVIKESLRLYPPVPLIGRKIDKETPLPSGMTLPAGCDVVVPIWGVHRDPGAWGPTADCFDPDRFLSEDTCGSYMPFSVGPRTCPGNKYALVAVKIALIAILRKYRVVGEEEPGPKPNIECIFSIMLREKNNYPICLEYR